jgi:excinuclease ABC subunit A
LAAVIDRIHELGEFSETNWDSRSIVEISATKKSDGWFLHAITAETWLLKLKFRVSRNTFKRDELQQRFKLKTLNQMDDLPVYGNEPRVKCKNLRGPFQEVELRLHDWAETDTPEFWEFIQQCVAGFNKHTERVETRPEDIMPWKKLGERWHFSRKGFSPGKRVVWPVELLEELFDLLREKAEDGQFLWNNQQVVRLFVPGQKEAWASVITKRATHVELILSGPKGGVALGRVAELGRNREMDGTRDANDFVHIEFHSVEDLHRGDLAAFLDEHIGLLKTTSK